MEPFCMHPFNTNKITTTGKKLNNALTLLFIPIYIAYVI